MSTRIHYVKIVDGVAAFKCQDPAAECHTYPACECESWNAEHAKEYGPGHEAVKHEKCWMQDWFDAPGVSYEGDEFTDMTDTGIPEDMNRQGYITTECDGETLTFEFEDETP